MWRRQCRPTLGPLASSWPRALHSQSASLGPRLQRGMVCASHVCAMKGHRVQLYRTDHPNNDCHAPGELRREVLLPQIVEMMCSGVRVKHIARSLGVLDRKTVYSWLHTPEAQQMIAERQARVRDAARMTDRELAVRARVMLDEIFSLGQGAHSESVRLQAASYYADTLGLKAPERHVVQVGVIDLLALADRMAEKMTAEQLRRVANGEVVYTGVDSSDGADGSAS